MNSLSMIHVLKIAKLESQVVFVLLQDGSQFGSSNFSMSLKPMFIFVNF